MKHLGEVRAVPPPPQQPPPRQRSPEASTQVRCLSLPHGGLLCLTEQQLGATGFRDVSYRGRRVQQFGLCRDATGEWVYPPFRDPEETAEDVIARSQETRRRMKLCSNRNQDDGTTRFG